MQLKKVIAIDRSGSNQFTITPEEGEFLLSRAVDEDSVVIEKFHNSQLSERYPIPFAKQVFKGFQVYLEYDC